MDIPHSPGHQSILKSNVRPDKVSPGTVTRQQICNRMAEKTTKKLKLVRIPQKPSPVKWDGDEGLQEAVLPWAVQLWGSFVAPCPDGFPSQFTSVHMRLAGDSKSPVVTGADSTNPRETS